MEFWMISAWWDRAFNSWNPSLDGFVVSGGRGGQLSSATPDLAGRELSWSFFGCLMAQQSHCRWRIGTAFGVACLPFLSKGSGRGKMSPVKLGRRKQQSELWFYLDFKWLHIKLPLTVWLLIATIHEKWLHFSSEISQSNSFPLEVSHLNPWKVLFINFLSWPSPPPHLFQLLFIHIQRDSVEVSVHLIQPKHCCKVPSLNFGRNQLTGEG